VNVRTCYRLNSLRDDSLFPQKPGRHASAFQLESGFFLNAPVDNVHIADAIPDIWVIHPAWNFS
jgi:hypothetical protein